MSDIPVFTGPPVPFESHLPPAIPPNVLPGIIGEYAAAVTESVQVPFELPLINAFGAVAASVQRKFRIVAHDGYSEPLNLYALAVLPPGERKSAVKDACRFPLVEWELEQQTALLSAHRVAIAQRQVREELHRALLSSARRCKTLEDRHELVEQLVALSEEEAKTPVAPRLLVDDATPEALAMVMAAQQQRIALLEAEGGFFDILPGRYSSGVPNLDVVLKAWNGEAIRIDRRHADPIILDNPTLTLILTAQPDVLSGMAQTPSFRGRGLMGRLLFFIPQSRVGLRHVETFPVPESLRLRWRQTLRHLLALPWDPLDSGQFLHLEHESKSLWLDFAAHVERNLAEGGRLSAMRDWGGKLPGQVLRLAGLCHVTQHASPETCPINTLTMSAVLQLADGLMEHARAAYSLMGADEGMECAKAILRWVEHDGLTSFTARSALEKVKGRWPRMDKVNAGLPVLEDWAYIAPLEPETGKRGRPTRVYMVNPQWRGFKCTP